MNVVILSRISSVGTKFSNRQDATRQILDLQEYAKRNDMKVAKVFEEHISGGTPNEERPILQECLSFCLNPENDIQMLLCSELSRLSRSVWDTMETIKLCRDKKLNVYFQKENLSLFLPDGEESPCLSILVSCLSYAYSVEKNSIAYRLSSGRRRFVEKNIKETGKSGLGRKVGYHKSKEKKEEEYKEAIKLLKQGYPYRKVAILTGRSERTIVRLKKEFNL